MKCETKGDIIGYHLYMDYTRNVWVRYRSNYYNLGVFKSLIHSGRIKPRLRRVR